MRRAKRRRSRSRRSKPHQFEFGDDLRLTPESIFFLRWRTAPLLLSMTGFGEAHRQRDSLAVSVEVRTINSRYFKLSVRCAEGYSALEPHIESVVRQPIKRG